MWVYDKYTNTIISPEGKVYHRGEFVPVPDTPNGRIQVKEDLVRISPDDDTFFDPYDWDAISWNEAIVLMLNKVKGQKGDTGAHLKTIQVDSDPETAIATLTETLTDDTAVTSNPFNLARGKQGEKGKEITDIETTSTDLGENTEIDFNFKFDDGTESGNKSALVRNGKNGSVTDVPDPVNPTDAVNKRWADSQLATKVDKSSMTQITTSYNGNLQLNSDARIFNGTTPKNHLGSWIDSKQGKLTEGDNIEISADNVISATVPDIHKLTTPVDVVSDTTGNTLSHADYNTAIQLYETKTNKSYLMSRDKLSLNSVGDTALRLQFDPATGLLQYFNTTASMMDEVATKEDIPFIDDGTDVSTRNADRTTTLIGIQGQIRFTPELGRIEIMPFSPSSPTTFGEIRGINTDAVLNDDNAASKKYVDSRITKMMNLLKQLIPEKSDLIEQLFQSIGG